MEIIIFKSEPDNYDKEEDSRKCNTERKIELDDERFDILARWMVSKKYGYIGIQNTVTKKSFMRKVTDVTVFKQLHVISWLP